MHGRSRLSLLNRLVISASSILYVRYGKLFLFKNPYSTKTEKAFSKNDSE